MIHRQPCHRYARQLRCFNQLALGMAAPGLIAHVLIERGDQMWKIRIERTAAQLRDLDSFSQLRRA